MKYYSAAARAFYDSAIHGRRMPSDVVEISEQEWAELLEAQSTGKEIAPGAGRRPMACTPVLTLEVRASIAQRHADVLVQRHAEELALGVQPTLSREQHIELLTWRHNYRHGRILEPPAWIQSN